MRYNHTLYTYRDNKNYQSVVCEIGERKDREEEGRRSRKEGEEERENKREREMGKEEREEKGRMHITYYIHIHTYLHPCKPLCHLEWRQQQLSCEIHHVLNKPTTTTPTHILHHHVI